MSSNVVDIFTATRYAARTSMPAGDTALVFSIATKRERQAMNETKAKKLFDAAVTINTLGADGKLKAIRIMFELCSGEFAAKAPKVRERAAAWMWEVCRIETQYDDGTPMSAARRSSARRREK